MYKSAITEVPIINTKSELKKYLRSLYIIEDYMDDPEGYCEFIQEINFIVKAIFVKEDNGYVLRTYPVKFKFYPEDTKTYTLEIRHFLANLMCWYPMCELKGIHVLDESFILKSEKVPDLEDFTNKKIIKPLQDYNVKQIIINRHISQFKFMMRGISLDYSDLMNLTFSEKDFINMHQDPKYRELMELKIPENAQATEIEDIIDNAQENFIKYLKEDGKNPDRTKRNPIGVILNVGSGMKEKQLTEYCIAMGMKPTLDGEVMPIAIENSSLIKGLDRPSYIYIDATGARKPLIMNNKMMGNAGYFGKMMNMLARTVEMSTHQSYCDTKHLVPYEIKTKKHLKKLVGKYYKNDLSETEYSVLDDTDKNKIGKTIFVRSAATCNCGQNTVCPTCIGKNADLLLDIASGIGVFFTEETSKVLEQNILSAKHLLTTHSEKIEFSEEFYKFFTITSGEINLSPDTGVDVGDLSIYVDMNHVCKMEEYDDDSTYNTYIDNSKFNIVNTRTGEMIDIEIKNKQKEIYIEEEFCNMLRSGNGYVSFKDIDPDTRIFELTIMNNELTKPLYDLMQILDHDEKNMEEVNINTISQRILDIMVEANIGAPMVSGELIINRLIRKADDITRRPSFATKTIQPYKIYTITKVLEHNGSILLGLGFQNIKRQLLDMHVGERNDESFLDACFLETIDTSKLKEYQEPEIEDSMESFYLNIH